MHRHLSLSSDHVVAVQIQIRSNGDALLFKQKAVSLYLQVCIIHHVCEAKFAVLLYLWFTCQSIAAGLKKKKDNCGHLLVHTGPVELSWREGALPGQFYYDRRVRILGVVFSTLCVHHFSTVLMITVCVYIYVYIYLLLAYVLLRVRGQELRGSMATIERCRKGHSLSCRIYSYNMHSCGSNSESCVWYCVTCCLSSSADDLVFPVVFILSEVVSYVCKKGGSQSQIISNWQLRCMWH